MNHLRMVLCTPALLLLAAPWATGADVTAQETAEEAAKIGGMVLMAKAREISRIGIHKKGLKDYVTDVDKESEERIVSFIGERFPDHQFQAEESTRSADDSEYLWIIDPLDGTTNYIHKYPFFSVSVAFSFAGKVRAGAVYDPVREEMFTASEGRGTFLNGEKIEVSHIGEMNESLIITGFPFREIENLELYISCFRRLFKASGGMRGDGSAALDLCFVAMGRAEGFWEFGLSVWDLAAGTLIVREAGGLCSDMRGGDRFLDQGDIVASNGRIHEELMRNLRDIIDA